MFRAEEGSRTPDLLITNQLLYQLSYFGLPIRTVRVKLVASRHPYFLDGKGRYI